MQGVGKLSIDAPSIPHQETCKVRSQHQSGLFKSASWLNGIDRYLRSAESPHPPQLSLHPPTGFIRGDTRTAANLFYQRVIRWFRFPRHPGQGLAQTTPTHLQSEGLLEHGGRLAIGKSQTFIELRGQRQSTRAQL